MKTALLFVISFSISVISLSGQELYFPPLQGNTWETLSQEDLGWCTEAVAELENFLEERNTKSFIILQDGKIALEKYFDDYTAESLWYWASAGKSLMATLIGLAQQDGDLSIYDPTSDYLGEGWTAAPPEKEDLIKIVHQISMTTGLDENYSMELGLGDCLEPACLQYGVDPGTHWYYFNSPYRLTQDVVEAATGQNLSLYTRNRLGDRIGMKGFWNNYIFWSKARDMARFGLFILNEGSWDQDNILSDADYYQAMTTPSQTLNPSYGYLWWLNGQESFKLPTLNVQFPGMLVPEAPADMFAAMGKNEQRVYVVPSLNMVVIRQGDAAGEAVAGPSSFDNQLWQHINQLSCITSTSEANVPQIRVFPNPTTQLLHLEQLQSNTGDLNFMLYNSTGRLVWQQQLEDDQQSVAMGTWPKGLYTYRIMDKYRTVQNGKIVLQ